MAKPASASGGDVSTVRAFNRFYTRQLGLLDEAVYASAFSLTEARVLYELASRDAVTASQLVRDLGLDAGYLSRLLAKFEAGGLITRTPSATDGRQTVLALTGKGRKAFAPLNRASHKQIAAMLAPLRLGDRERLVGSMRTIETVLGGAPEPEPKVPYVLRGLQSGDIGWVIRRQSMLYTQEHGWDETFEGLVAEIAAAFVKTCNPKKERCWIAEREGEIVGSVFLVRQSDRTAKLRLLYVEPSARGLGIGRRLVEECIGFARAKGYKTLTLWTNDILVAARRIYQAAGFQLVKEEPHHSFGKDLVGQNWDLAL
jgi:DNA-binding MarR family transcriptional regulator/GNAT superfamily N-acetyltransferase